MLPERSNTTITLPGFKTILVSVFSSNLPQSVGSGSMFGQNLPTVQPSPAVPLLAAPLGAAEPDVPAAMFMGMAMGTFGVVGLSGLSAPSGVSGLLLLLPPTPAAPPEPGVC